MATTEARALAHDQRTAENYLDRLAQSEVPTHLHEGLVRYLADHIRPGRFLMAVLESNLSAAMGAADEECQAKLSSIIGWLYNQAPGDAWGSVARVRVWLQQRKDGAS